MERSRRRDVAAKAAGLRTRIEHWRKARRTREPMPESLWRQAAELARVFGINPIAETLNLNYYDLKRRAEESAPRRARPRKPVFVEVTPTSPLCAARCVVEMARPDGAKMTIRMDGGRDLVALTDAFWSRRP